MAVCFFMVGVSFMADVQVCVHDWSTCMFSQLLMGLPYGTIPRKTVPRAEQDTAMDYSVLMDFNVGGCFGSETVILLTLHVHLYSTRCITLAVFSRELWNMKQMNKLKKLEKIYYKTLSFWWINHLRFFSGSQNNLGILTGPWHSIKPARYK